MSEALIQSMEIKPCTRHGLYPCPHNCFGKIYGFDQYGNEYSGYGDKHEQ